MASAAGPVVVGYDGRDESEVALERGFAEAATRGVALTVVIVEDPPVAPLAPLDSGDAFAFTPLPEWTPEGSPAMQYLVDAARRRIDESGVDGSVTSTYGDPASEIVRIADEVGASAIVVGTHHHSALSRLLGGDIAARVANDAHCEVIVAQ